MELLKLGNEAQLKATQVACTKKKRLYEPEAYGLRWHPMCTITFYLSRHKLGVMGANAD
jgi:hypothetical protein